MAAVWRLVYFLAPCPPEPKEQTAAHRRDALCPSTKIQKQAAPRAVGAPDFKRRSRRFSEMGVRAVCVHKKEGLLPAPR